MISLWLYDKVNKEIGCFKALINAYVGLMHCNKVIKTNVFKLNDLPVLQDQCNKFFAHRSGMPTSHPIFL